MTAIAAEDIVRPRRLWPVVAALVIVFAALVLPDRANRLAPAAFLRLPIEAPLALFFFALPLGRLRPIATAMAGIALALLIVLKIADVAVFEALGRAFDPVLDSALFRPAFELLAGTLGTAGAGLAAVAAVLALLAAAALGIAGAAGLSVFGRRHRPAALALGLVLLAGWASLHAFGAGAAPADSGRYLVRHVEGAIASLGDRAAFEAEAAIDPFFDVASDRLLAGLAGKDVLLVFVESYGRSAIEDPRYAPAVTEVLAEAEKSLAAAGFSARSAWLRSPTVGGQSWLAHGTLLSGLRVDNQRRYLSLVGSARATLVSDFRRAGWRTVAVMPAITRAWPEGSFFGYDRIYDRDGLGYRGLPFNWVTMPDQFTLAAFDRAERESRGCRPVFAEIALISSHAPWTPIPSLLSWDAVGDGSVFNGQATEGDPPDVVWRDPERVRLQYRLSIEYALANLTSYVAAKGDENLVLLVLGDHQPAPLITGEDATRDVPVHLIAADPKVLDAATAWGWTAGLLPDPSRPPEPMEDVRTRLLSSFTP